MTDFRFDAPIGGVLYIDTTEADLRAAGVAPADVAAALAAATARAVEAEMRRRVSALWAGKRPSAQSWWTAIVAKGAGATDPEKADAAAIGAGDAWEGTMLDCAKALAARGDRDAAATDAAWPAAPAALVALLAEPFAL